METSLRSRGFLVGGLVCALIGCALGEDSVQSALLDYSSDGFCVRVPIDLHQAGAPLDKEPDFGSRRVVRGRLPGLGCGKSGMEFAWVKSKRALYLDLDRDRDLSDETGLCAEGEDPDWQPFRNISVAVPSCAVTVPHRIDLTFSNLGQGQQAELSFRSGWNGDIELGGQVWQVAVVDNLDGKIDGQDVLSLTPKSTGTHSPIALRPDMPVPQELFLDGRNYRVRLDFEERLQDLPAGEGPAVSLRACFQEASCVLWLCPFYG